MLPKHISGNRCRIAAAVTLAMASMASAEQVENQEAPQSFLLDQIVVTATKTENNLATAPASMSVISAEEIQSQPNTNLADIVERAVGVEAMKDGARGGRQMVSIRGMDSKYTMIMVNGRKMSSSNAVVRGNDFDLTSIPQDNIERIEIIRGPMSALYGSEALGGVVNIITKVPDNEWSSSISGDFSTPTGNDGGDEYTLGINTGGALIDDKLYLNVSASQTSRNAWTPYSNIPERDFDRTEVTALEEMDVMNFSSAVNWLVNDEQSVDLDVSHSRDEREAVNETSSELSFSEQEVTRSNVALTHNGDWSWGTSQLRYNHEQVVFDEYSHDNARWDEITEINNTVDGSASKGFRDHQLTVGGEVRHTELDNTRDLAGAGNETVSQQAMFVQDEWSMAEDWTLTYGARLDNHEEFGSQVSPRVYMVNSVTDNLVVKGGVGQAFKAPTLLQLSEDYELSSCRGGCTLAGNPDLEPETSTSYELSANYQQDNWMVEAAVFRNDVENLIQADPNRTGDGGTYYYENVDEVQIDGVEIGGRIDLNRAFALSADYTYIDAKDLASDEQLTNRPKHAASARLDWQADDKLTSFVRASYTGTQKINDDIDLDGYTRLDIGANYQVTSDLRLRAGVTNLTNEELPEEVILTGYSEDPRTWYVGFTSTF